MRGSKILAVIIGEAIILILAFLLARDVKQVSEIAFLLTLIATIILGSYFAYKMLKSAK